LDQDVLHFYQNLANQHGIPYQTLINLVLKKFLAEQDKIIIAP
jgi:predicted DNA binding CopG/RHH family protein